MALFAINSRCLLIGLFVVVVLVVALGQMAYISPRQVMASIQNESELELVQLRLENSGLKEQGQELKHIKEEHEEEIKLIKGDITKITEERKLTETQLNKIQKEKEDLEKKVAQLQSSSATTTKAAEVQKDVPVDKAILDLLNAPQNVLTNKDTLIYLLNNFNTYGAIRNEANFTLEKDFIPIVIRVYNKHEYFGWALENYRKVKGIDKTMMIISHDGIFPEMFKLVQAIDFCQVKQIIHPYSGHFLMNRFPGPDQTIPNAKDQYNNARSYIHAALKHHFWWHLNYVWDQLLPSHAGDMVFMEEDHVPTTDYYATVKALRTIRNERCPDCFNAKIHQHGHSESGLHDVFLTHDLGNVGMIFSRQRWEQLRKAGKEFCTFDDYNWDWTMGHLTATKAIAPLSLTASFPRAEHMGKCGTHAHNGACEISEEDKRHFLEVNKRLEVDGGNWEKYNFNSNPVDPPRADSAGWGGWAHPMDQQHCINLIKKVT